MQSDLYILKLKGEKKPNTIYRNTGCWKIIYVKPANTDTPSRFADTFFGYNSMKIHLNNTRQIKKL